ncbi:hypothetical protein FRC18_002704 [Serendipita sp. 400]|nr:hypothetical protein FRC18_002704 [Serendipita sp. 400]
MACTDICSTVNSWKVFVSQDSTLWLRPPPVLPLISTLVRLSGQDKKVFQTNQVSAYQYSRKYYPDSLSLSHKLPLLERLILSLVLLQAVGLKKERESSGMNLSLVTLYGALKFALTFSKLSSFRIHVDARRVSAAPNIGSGEQENPVVCLLSGYWMWGSHI